MAVTPSAPEKKPFAPKTKRQYKQFIFVSARGRHGDTAPVAEDLVEWRRYSEGSADAAGGEETRTRWRSGDKPDVRFGRELTDLALASLPTLFLKSF